VARDRVPRARRDTIQKIAQIAADDLENGVAALAHHMMRVPRRRQHIPVTAIRHMHRAHHAHIFHEFKRAIDRHQPQFRAKRLPGCLYLRRGERSDCCQQRLQNCAAGQREFVSNRAKQPSESRTFAMV
jgi:hypothetical protein